jgi:hypothetical protein
MSVQANQQQSYVIFSFGGQGESGLDLLPQTTVKWLNDTVPRLCAKFGALRTPFDEFSIPSSAAIFM